MTRLRPIFVILPFLSLGLGFGVQKTLMAKAQASRQGGLPALIFVAAPTAVAGRLTERFPQGSRLLRYVPGMPPGSAADLTPTLFAVADPRISSDATTVLFSGQKRRWDHWQIWTIKVDGSALRQITHCLGDCLQPAYLPQNQIVFTLVSRKGSKQSSSIYVSSLNGSHPHPVTFGPGNYQVEAVLHSGRLLITAQPALVPGQADNGSRVFYTLRPDGSGLSLLRWGSQPNYRRGGATELEDGAVLFVESRTTGGKLADSSLAWIRPGALHSSALTPPNAIYWSAHVLDGTTLVVAKKTFESPTKAGGYSLYAFNLANKSISAEIYANPNYSSLDAVPVEQHMIPLYYPSVLRPDRDFGRVVCLNAYLSSGVPNDLIGSHIAKVRVIALGPDNWSERLLGEAPVENDGSFYIKIPSDHPVRFELIGKNGSVIREQDSWIWVRNGEDMACLGCHENNAVVPQDHFPLALKGFDTPYSIGLSAQSQPHNH